MKLSANGAALIKRYEKLALTAYLCPARVWTIGWGHTGADVGPGLTCTEARAEQWFDLDNDTAERAINEHVKVPLDQHQFDALVSLVFNIGVGAFSRSTLLRLLNAHDVEGAAQQFVRWNRVGGDVVDGLSRRRREEERLFRSALGEDAHGKESPL